MIYKTPLALVIVFMIGACQNKEELKKPSLLRSVQHRADVEISPPPKDKSEKKAIVDARINNNELSSKSPGEMMKEEKFQPPPPTFLPPPLPPLPPKPEGFVRYDGPVMSLCGNGVLDKIFSYTTCNPVAVSIDARPCVPQLYIEQCDDGNIISNDGCSSSCMKECCGNGIIEFGETCDAGQRTGALPPNFSPPAGFPPSTIAPAPALPFPPFTVFPDIPQAACSTTFATTDVGNCSRHCQLIVCGDGFVNGTEECDDGNDQCCDGCFKCRLELPNTCPCNCVPPNVRCPDPSKPCPELNAG